MRRGPALQYLLVGLCFSSSCSASSPPALRAIPVAEDTPSPGTSSSYYALCATLNLEPFITSITAASNECAIKTSYDWASMALPTAAERRELCSCTQLMGTLQEVKIPRCSVFKDGRQVSYTQLVQYAFGLCNLDGTVTSGGGSSTTTTTTTPTTTTDGPSDDPSGQETKSHTGLIVGIVVGVVLVAAVAVFVGYKYGKRRRAAAKSEAAGGDGEHQQDAVEALPLSPLEGLGGAYVALSPGMTTTAEPAYPVTTAKAVATMRSSQLTAASTGGSGSGGGGAALAMRPSEMPMWDDPVLLAVRVPYDTVFFGPLLSRGGYGEVYKGTYKGETVAIKQLLPERRKDLVQIDAFLSEIRLMSTLEHERIVAFIGVAWNALSDACVITEYMENGDLRSVLMQWSGQGRSQGFDSDKLKIALHVAHALTYLHSLQPVVVHRDLKSKNILLNASYDAKLTDFGVSRERADETMTGGVGSSLWMAPEVMLGERYDEKADVFSFGVVLSELDTHKLPYSHAKESGTDRRLADSAMLQMVSLGRLTISFSENAQSDLVQLGRDCVLLDASKRPTAAQVLYRIHQVLRSFA